MAKKILTISREFGSGGRTVGKRAAELLGVPYYDKELVKEVAAKTGFTERFVEQAGEDAPGKTWFSAMLLGSGLPGAMNGLSANDFLWAIQYQVIQELAEKGPCVIVGRCADWVLRDREDCLNAFIYASEEKRAQRIVRQYGQSEKRPEKRLEDKDKKRRVYYQRYTTRDWGDPENYHICLNSGVLGIEGCARLLVGLME
jgi:cytidylate kinase